MTISIGPPTLRNTLMVLLVLALHTPIVPHLCLEAREPQVKAVQQQPPATQRSRTPPSQVGGRPQSDVSTVPAGPQAPVSPPPGYVIGPDDVLNVLFRYDRDLSAEVVVRPDGKISLPLLHDVLAAGLTPEQLRDKITESAKRFIEDPAVTVMVKAINSRKVYITGEVTRPGGYPINDRVTVMQLIALAGGLTEFADSKHIVILRRESDGTVRPRGEPVTFPFNYKDFIGRRNLAQNIELKPGDTIIVP